MQAAARHRCMIYEGSPESQLPYLAALLAQQLHDGARCLYLNSEPMVQGLRATLNSIGVNVETEVRKGSLQLSSDQSHLIDGRFDSAGMLRKLARVVATAHSDGYSTIWITGDMTWEFGDSSNLPELLAYERGLEEAFHKLPGLHGVCQYHHSTLPTKAIRDALSTHQAVYLNQTLFRVNPYYAPDGHLSPAAIPTEVEDLLVRFNQQA